MSTPAQAPTSFRISTPNAHSMARLNDEQPGVSPDHILSPQPRATRSKEQLIAALETSHIPPSETASTVDDGQMSTREDEYISSGSSTRHSSSDIFGRDMDDELEQMKSRASSRSSVSSLPASVLVHPLDQSKTSMHDKIAGYTIEDDEASFGGFHDPPRSIRTIRQREAAFRKPSSVRAMQMHTEDEADDDEFLTPPRRRPGMRSPGLSPLKRSPYYSPAASPNKPKVKKEYPLVLLHCTLLAPSLPVPGASDLHNQKLVEEVLPPQYWKRWRRLQEKAGSGVLRDRGVLISHPEDLYDVLEERLLESLELQRSRLDHGHYIGHEESGPASEGELSDPGESETDGEQGEECPDCGRRVLRHNDSNRKWEIRVYAANGLMRAGAWVAAWKEMEKVDVEVGVWLPSDVRRALEKRLAEAAKEAANTEALDSNPSVDIRSRPISGHARAFSNAELVHSGGSSNAAPGFAPSVPDVKSSEPRQENARHQIALRTLVINYIRVLANDRRNIALVVMSILVVFLAIGSQQQRPFSHLTRQSFPDIVGPPAVLTTNEQPLLSATLSVPVEESMPVTGGEVPTPSSESIIASLVEESTPSSSVEAFASSPVIEQPPAASIAVQGGSDHNADGQPASSGPIDAAPSQSAPLEEPQHYAFASRIIELVPDQMEYEKPTDSTSFRQAESVTTSESESDVIENTGTGFPSMAPEVSSLDTQKEFADTSKSEIPDEIDESGGESLPRTEPEEPEELAVE